MPSCGARLQHFDRRTVAHDFKHQLPIFRIRNLENVTPLLVKITALLGMPVFRSNPARTIRAKPQFRPLQFGSAEYSVAGGQIFLQRLVRHLACFFARNRSGLNAVNRKTAQALPQVAPGVDIPIFPIINQALRRDLTLGDLVAATRVVMDQQAFAVGRRMRRGCCCPTRQRSAVRSHAATGRPCRIFSRP